MWNPTIPRRNIYLVRHGESDQNIAIKANTQKFDTPDHAVQLTDAGLQQAYQAGLFLAKRIENPEHAILYNSPYRRTRETAQEIMKTIKPGKIRENDMLVELQFGMFDGVAKSRLPDLYPSKWANYQRNRQFQGKFFARRPNGESPLDCEIRQKLFLQDMQKDLLDLNIENIIIVGHGAQLTCLRKAMFSYTHEWYEIEPNPGNCSIQLITYDIAAVEDKGYIYGQHDD